MTDTPAPLVDLDALRHAAADAVAALPGVRRLEPTLASALHRLRTATGRVASRPVAQSAADGIRITHRGNTVDIHVDLTVDATRPAAETARAAQDVLREAASAAQLQPGRLSVTVLRLQP